MSILRDIADLLKRPQSAATGALAALSPGSFENSRVANMSSGEAWKAGLSGDLSPSDLMDQETDFGPIGNILRKLDSSGTNMFADPLVAAGPALKAAGAAGKLGKASPLIESAATIGPLADDASKAQKIAQAARQVYQGTLATGELGTGLGAGLLLRGVENRVLPAMATKFAGRAAASSVDDVVDAINPDKAMADAIGLAESAVSRPMPNKVGHQLLNADEAMGKVRPTLMNPVPETIEGVERLSPELLQGTNRASVLEERVKALMAGPDPADAIPVGPASPPPTRPKAFLPDNVTAPRQQLTGMMEEAMTPRPELPRGQLTGPSPVPNYDEQLAAIIGRRGNEALQQGERGDELIRQILGSGRAGTGRFTTAEQRRLLEFLRNDPEGLNYVISQLRYK